MTADKMGDSATSSQLAAKSDTARCAPKLNSPDKFHVSGATSTLHHDPTTTSRDLKIVAHFIYIHRTKCNVPLTQKMFGVTKWRRMRWAGHVARMGEKRGVYRVLVGKPDGKRPLWTRKHRWEDNIKIDQIKHQLDATLCRFYFCRVTLHVSGVRRSSSGVLKNWHGGPWYRCYSCR